MADTTINNLPVLAGELSMPRGGAWHAKIQTAGESPLSGAVTIRSGGQAFVGTVLRSGVDGGRVLTRVAGGAGKLPTQLPAKNYANSTGVKIRQVIADLLREAGEELSSASESALLDRTVPKWERSAGPASGALRDVLEPFGGVWRVLADGTVWVGPVSFPAQAVDHVLLDEDWIAGVLEIASERPELRPGVTFLGHRVSYVVHRFDPGRLRTEAHIVGSPANLLERMLEPVRREIDFSRPWPAKVTKQNADGTVQVLPDDERIRGRGMDKVPIRYGIPAEIEVSQGARCLIAFAGGDPARPFVLSWESKAVDKVSINGGTLPAARQGDLVEVFPLGMTVTIGLPPGGTPAPLSSATPYPLFFIPPPPAPSVPLPYLYAPISSGNPAIEE
jgi:hypothetical protein